ncbi:conserved hypothetical protein [Lodderomyces elongisporus NRRL YB-4239]|uniref:HTH CENPB-type domain-containing protein n=1 Tax=Lodderomyces elongisporus (strain ATCC 11503 / CBS 2605 / JCM 1781 / NBRC 1676 / NRRL YB-4239) TaxID=379508 RepID=A5E1L5_LODEL|nr:conserved hypothetical protein [Lodderomyces elongisporus NRRL YB-4239]
MGYTIKQKIDICLKAEANPQMTQFDLALWAMKEYGSLKPPSQTTISRILSSKNDIIASREGDFKLVRRRKQTNPILRKILAEWITQLIWENIPVTIPIVQLTANNIWTRLPASVKSGNGIFSQKWCSHFIKKLNVNITGDTDDKDEKRRNFGYPLNKVWKLDEKIELKQYLNNLIANGEYSPKDVFVVDEFQLFYSLPLDQIFDVSSIDKGLPQNHQQQPSNEDSLTILLGCNIDGLEKLTPLIVGKYDKFDVSQSSLANLQNINYQQIPQQQLMNKITENYNVIYKSNTYKWITSQMFQNYLITLDHKIHNQTPNRQLLVILDDCSSHRIINVKFQHIKLIYLKNETSHKNPYNTAYSGVKFDYLPMNFGIIEEFKIFYRSQQYAALINLQRSISKKNDNRRIQRGPGSAFLPSYTNNASGHIASIANLTPTPTPTTANGTTTTTTTSSALEVLSEHDYHIPLVKVIEWVTKSWLMVSPARIFHSWRRTHLLQLKHNQWPCLVHREMANQIVDHMERNLLVVFDENASKRNLEEQMSYLNVVIPWEIDELIGLVNERGKVTLSYASIEEIIGSCLLESRDPEYEDVGGESLTVSGTNGVEGLDEEDIEMADAINNMSQSITTTPSWNIIDLELNQASSILFNRALVESGTNGSTGTNNNFNKHKLAPIENGVKLKQPNMNNVASHNIHHNTDNFNNLSNHNSPPISNITTNTSFSFLTPTLQLLSQVVPKPQLFNQSSFSAFSLPSAPPQQEQQQQQQQQQQHNKSTQQQRVQSMDADIINCIAKILNYSDLKAINISQSTIDDLTYNSRVIRNRAKQ